MAEEKKDLTGLLQYSKALQDAGQAPPVPEGSVMDEVPIEKIDSFESLEEYAVSNPPPPEPTPAESAPDLSFSPPSDDFQVTPASENAPPPSEFANSDFPVSPAADHGDFPPSDFSTPRKTKRSRQAYRMTLPPEPQQEIPNEIETMPIAPEPPSVSASAADESAHESPPEESLSLLLL